MGSVWLGYGIGSTVPERTGNVKPCCAGAGGHVAICAGFGIVFLPASALGLDLPGEAPPGAAGETDQATAPCAWFGFGPGLPGLADTALPPPPLPRPAAPGTRRLAPPHRTPAGFLARGPPHRPLTDRNTLGAVPDRRAAAPSDIEHVQRPIPRNRARPGPPRSTAPSGAGTSIRG
ncbi:hypothetical protein LNKW23_02010 [Paralimibaculum aggregatum]|uniref:Uncharacterized protein n=1 Tax=Paralimibaculum aggregatum TaxID=3036245 RepID=A0ABQ6LC93_9RHOB|nr:hypothetical protein LNKW23_02010 [Limibaculum sp. NKW23]